jgi:hypothetical protein
MNKVYLNKDIFYIENVLEQELLDEIQSVINNENEWINEGVSHEQPSVKFLGAEIINKLKNIFNDILIFDNLPESKIIRDPAYVSRYQTDQSLFVHWDADPTQHPECRTRYGAVLYINDDFEGGELFYPKIELTIKPKKNMFICHRGDMPEYEHGINKIIKGNRYTITTFIYCCSSKYEDCRCNVN